VRLLLLVTSNLV